MFRKFILPILAISCIAGIVYSAKADDQMFSASGGSSGPSGTGANGQVTLWSGASTLKGDTGLTFSGTGTSLIVFAPTFKGVAGTVLTLQATTQTAAASAVAGTGLAITADPAVAGSTNAGAAAGGSVTITAGNAARLTSGNANGGDITLTPGTGIGTGTTGSVLFTTGKIGTGNSTTLNLTSGNATVATIGNNALGIGSSGSVETTASGGYSWSSTGSSSGSADVILTRGAAATLQLGDANAASPVSQTIQAQGSRGGTDTNVAGGVLTLQPGSGTGTAASRITLNRGITKTSGATQQTYANAVSVCGSKTLSNTSATATALANVTVASGAMGAARATFNVQCTNGTEVASSTVTSYQSFANKAGTIAFGTATTLAEANAASTGATINCTVAPTWVASGNSVDVKVTPVITGSPTVTSGFINIETFGVGTVTCN